MEFNEKLQQLRKQKGITQDELAEAIFVSRTAVSKWESGRGYPSIESLKALSKFYEISIDNLLSGEQLLVIAEEDTNSKRNHFCDIVFGLLDISTVLFYFVPFFGQSDGDAVHAASLLSLCEISLYLRVSYFAAVVSIILIGILILALQKFKNFMWISAKYKISLVLTVFAVFLFVISTQPYAAAFMLVMLIIKAILLIKWK